MGTRFTSRMEERLREEVSRVILHELHDPRLGFLTVTRVKVEGDMRTAKVYVSVFGEENVKKRVLAGLRHARGYVQTKVAKRIRIKRVPIISFHLDDFLGGSEDQEPPAGEIVSSEGEAVENEGGTLD